MIAPQKEGAVLYFAYGSNMSLKRLRQRIPSARLISRATLAGHRLLFHKIGQDGTAKCDIYQTGQAADAVIGIVFEISEAEKAQLDRIEGLGHGYADKRVVLTGSNRQRLQATTYYATKIDSSLKPYHWYKNHVLQGAIEHGLPKDYLHTLLEVESIADPEAGRHERETAIYLDSPPP